MELTKEAAKKLVRGDFIPDGDETIDLTSLKFRRTRNDEVFQCHQQTGYDTQSGPMYCGKIAEFVSLAEKDGEIIGVVALCNHNRHRPPKDLIFVDSLMDDAHLKKTYLIKLENGIYVITGQPETDLLPQFLARNPYDNELFFLFGNNGTQILLKGNEKNGLRICQVEISKKIGDCCVLGFYQDNFHGIIYDQTFAKHKIVSIRYEQASMLLDVQLEVELFEIIR